ncbi:MAG: hypothetical protein QOE98_1061, partial [Gaiellaceae bacterium]|nr:hypothetical protein [Gaiellaceae bacterium]
LRGASGSQFDQRVVEALIRVLGDVQSAKRPYLTGADQAA